MWGVPTVSIAMYIPIFHGANGFLSVPKYWGGVRKGVKKLVQALALMAPI